MALHTGSIKLHMMTISSLMVWLHARLINVGGCVDLSMDTMYLEISLNLPLVLLSSRVIML